MATTSPVAVQLSDSLAGRRTNPLHLWHLLSLDAPTVAMLWTWFLARANHIAIPANAIAAMGIAVWLLYAADRLLDARSIGISSSEHEERHHFHRQHSRWFRAGIGLASLALSVLVPNLAPQSTHLYLILGALLFGYFAVIHSNGGTHRVPKEIFVGIFFSAATFIPTISRRPELRLTLLPGAILFAALCCLNCLFIYAWEHPIRSTRAHPLTNLALRFLPHLALTLVAVAFTLASADHSLPSQIPAACALAATLLILLHRNRNKASATSLRAAADLCLLTPLLLLPFLR